MTEGKLIYAYDINRLDILMADGQTYGGLHCGDPVDILSESGEWIEACVEYAGGQGEWYMPGLYGPGQIPFDLQVRIPDRRRFL